MKKITTFVVLMALLLGAYTPSTSAANFCDQYKGVTKIWWDGIELKKGQIGRLTVKQDTPLYKLEGDKKTFSRTLKAGEFYRIYAFKPGKLSVGGGYYVDRDEKVTYQSPSKTKLDAVKCINGEKIITNNEVKLTTLPYYSKAVEDHGDIKFNNWGNSNFKVNGKEYQSGIGFHTGSWRWQTATIEYKFNNQYSTLKFKVGVDDLSIGTGGTGTIKVYGDGSLIYDSGTLEAQDDANAVSLNIKSYSKVKFEIYNDMWNIGVVVVDPVLLP